MSNVINMGKGLNHMVDLSLIRPESVVIDGGAAKGDFIEAYRKLDNESKIFAFEPNRTNLVYIKNNIDLHDVVLIDKALVGNDHHGKVMFSEFVGVNGRYYQWGNIYGTHAKKKRKELKEVIEYEVDTITLLDIVEKYDIKDIGFMKLDVEGAEKEIIETLSADILKIIRQISLEYHSAEASDFIRKFLEQEYEVNEDLIHGEIYAKRKQ